MSGFDAERHDGEKSLEIELVGDPTCLTKWVGESLSSLFLRMAT